MRCLRESQNRSTSSEPSIIFIFHSPGLLILSFILLYFIYFIFSALLWRPGMTHFSAKMAIEGRIKKMGKKADVDRRFNKWPIHWVPRALRLRELF